MSSRITWIPTGLGRWWISSSNQQLGAGPAGHGDAQPLHHRPRILPHLAVRSLVSCNNVPTTPTVKCSIVGTPFSRPRSPDSSAPVRWQVAVGDSIRLPCLPQHSQAGCASSSPGPNQPHLAAGGVHQTQPASSSSVYFCPHRWGLKCRRSQPSGHGQRQNIHHQMAP